MSEEYNFQEELKNSLASCDITKFKRIDLLEDIFKSYVAKLFEFNLGRKEKDRLEVGVMVEVKRNLINEFMKADLEECQRPVEWYETLFDKTVQEIFNDAANNHRGVDMAEVQQTLSINKDAYVNEGGLYVPSYMKR